MKKIFTLIATALMTMGASAQDYVIDGSNSTLEASTVTMTDPFSGTEVVNPHSATQGEVVMYLLKDGKTLSGGNTCTFEGANVKPIKLSNGAPNAIVLPDGVTINKIEFIGYCNTANETSWISNLGVMKNGAYTDLYTCDGTFDNVTYLSKDDCTGGAELQTITINNISASGTIYFKNGGKQPAFIIRLYKSEAGGDNPVVTDGEKLFGIKRPVLDGGIYDDFSYITTEDFVMDKDGIGKDMNVKFYESDAIHATVVKDETSESGYGVATNIRKHGSAVSVDYYWKIQCSDPDQTTHLHNGVKVNGEFTDVTPNEDFTFGFDFTVPTGKSLEVSKIFFNLLVEQNASTCVRILKGTEEIYNSGWSYAANGYNSHKTKEGEWVYGWCAGIENDTWCAYYGDDYTTLFSTDAVKDFMVQNGGGYETLNNLNLTDGDYRCTISVDWNNENPKALSFDEVTITGNLADATGISSTTAEKVVKNSAIYNLAGQRVSAPVKGQIYIQNGKKFIQK